MLHLFILFLAAAAAAAAGVSVCLSVRVSMRVYACMCVCACFAHSTHQNEVPVRYNLGKGLGDLRACAAHHHGDVTTRGHAVNHVVEYVRAHPSITLKPTKHHSCHSLGYTHSVTSFVSVRVKASIIRLATVLESKTVLSVLSKCWI